MWILFEQDVSLDPTQFRTVIGEVQWVYSGCLVSCCVVLRCAVMHFTDRTALHEQYCPSRCARTLDGLSVPNRSIFHPSSVTPDLVSTALASTTSMLFPTEIRVPIYAQYISLVPQQSSLVSSICKDVPLAVSTSFRRAFIVSYPLFLLCSAIFRL